MTSTPTERHDGGHVPAGPERPAADTVSALSGLPWAVASRDLPAPTEAGPAAVAAWLAETERLGADCLLLASVREASATLQPGELAEVRDEARRRGVRIEACFGPLHPGRLDRGEATALLEAGAALDVSAYHLVFGLMEDRLAGAAAWSAALAEGPATVRWVLDRTSATAVFRTHEEMTSFELVRLVDAVNSDRVRIGFSPVNLVTRLEDPWAAFCRVESLIHTVFLDDTWIVRTSHGLARRLCRFADGGVPWLRILTALSERDDVTYLVDVHRAEFEMPLFDCEWLAQQPDLTAAELAALYAVSSAAGSQVEAWTRAEWLKAMLAQDGSDGRFLQLNTIREMEQVHEHA